MKNIQVIIQSRLSSTRLPAKALLPLGGRPMVVLCARRAANTGLPVLVATSQGTDNAPLEHALRVANIPHFCGELENTLKRIVDAVAGLEDDTIIVRLTADNVIPDGKFIDDFVATFEAKGCAYMTSSSADSGLPYGVSVEVTYLKHLRQAHALANSAYDREHVTPFIIRKFGAQALKTHAALNMSHFRATVDSFDDYLAICTLFEGEPDPVGVPWDRLVQRMRKNSFQPAVPTPPTKYVVGAANLGMEYGILNSGVLEQSQAIEMVRSAIRNGASGIDTAPAYHNSEVILGAALSGGWHGRTPIVTKLATLSDVSDTADKQTVNLAVDLSITRSQKRLGMSPLGTVLLHRADHMTAWGGAVFQRLLSLMAEGQLQRLGVSVQSPDELRQALERPEVSHIQLPFNIADHRWDRMIEQIKTQRLSGRNLTIHTRSPFLQGLLLSDDAQHWHRANCPDGGTHCRRWLQECLSKTGHQSKVDLCLAYLIGQDWIDGVVIGSQSSAQLVQNIKRFAMPALSPESIKSVHSQRPYLATETLDPAKWIRK